MWRQWPSGVRPDTHTYMLTVPTSLRRVACVSSTPQKVRPPSSPVMEFPRMETIYQRLVTPGAPSIHVVEMTEEVFHTWQSHFRTAVPQAVIYVLQGKKLST